MYSNILDQFKYLPVFCIKDEYSSELFNDSEAIQDYQCGAYLLSSSSQPYTDRTRLG